MSDLDGFRSDEERLEAIEKSGERMCGPKGVDFDELQKKIMSNCEPIFKAQIAFDRFLESIIVQGHSLKSFFKWWRLMRSLPSVYLMRQHVQHCEDCKPVLREALRQVEIFSQMTLIPPRIVTKEDGERAAEYLAKINGMTKEEFWRWTRNVSDRVIQDMNKAG